VTPRRFLKRLGLVVFLLAGARDLSAQPSSRAMERFEKAYRSCETLQANFLEFYSESGRQVRAEAGLAYFARPGRMRWEYRSPETNLYVVDGKWAWFYVPADHTATRIKARASADWRTPLALLAGQMKVAKICRRVFLDSSLPPLKPGHLMLRCELRGGTQDGSGGTAERVLLEVDPASGELGRILVSDPGGVQVEFRFSNWEFNPHLDPRMFRFEPPKGVAIVEGDFGSAPLALAEKK